MESSPNETEENTYVRPHNTRTENVRWPRHVLTAGESLQVCAGRSVKSSSSSSSRKGANSILSNICQIDRYFQSINQSINRIASREQLRAVKVEQCSNI